MQLRCYFFFSFMRQEKDACHHVYARPYLVSSGIFCSSVHDVHCGLNVLSLSSFSTHSTIVPNLLYHFFHLFDLLLVSAYGRSSPHPLPLFISNPAF